MTRTLFILGLLILTAGCQSGNLRQELAKTWKYDLDATREEMMRRAAPPSEMNYMESMFFNLKNAEIHFEQNGKVIFQMEDFEQNGQWKVNNKKNELRLDFTGSEQVSRIDYLSPDTLILLPIDSSQSITFPRVLVAK